MYTLTFIRIDVRKVIEKHEKVIKSDSAIPVFQMLNWSTLVALDARADCCWSYGARTVALGNDPR